METKITATELSKTLSDILSRVRYRGERFLIERNGEPVATLTPASPAPGISLSELSKRLGNLYLPGEGFVEDLEAIQSGQPREGSPAWRS